MFQIYDYPNRELTNLWPGPDRRRALRNVSCLADELLRALHWNDFLPTRDVKLSQETGRMLGGGGPEAILLASPPATEQIKIQVAGNSISGRSGDTGDVRQR